MTAPGAPDPGPGPSGGPTQPRRPEGRYDEPQPPNRFLVVGAATVLAIGVTYGVVRLYDTLDASVSVRTSVIDIDDRSVRLVFEVSKDPGRAAQCFLRAQSERRELVGSTIVVVPAGERRTRVEQSFPVTARPFAAEVLRCQLLPRGVTTPSPLATPPP